MSAAVSSSSGPARRGPETRATVRFSSFPMDGWPFIFFISFS
jgi:hypothetical protein